MVYAQTYIRYNGKNKPDTKMYTHRFVWEQANGSIPDGCDIDHINGDKRDNRLSNLRLSNKSTNGFNRPAQANNKLGAKNVYYNGFSYTVQVAKRGVRYSGGSYATLPEAIAAATSLRNVLHGEFACHT